MAGAAEDTDTIVLPSGQGVQNAFVEEIARELVPPLDQVAVLQHGACVLVLVTLRLSEDLAGRLLGDDALALARQHGSSANTLITARRCASFRRGLEASLAKVNLALAAAGHADVQIQRCHVLLNGFCKEDNTLKASGAVNRPQIARKHANLLHTLAAPVCAGDALPAGTVAVAADKNAARKGPKKYSVMAHARWLERKPGDQQPLVTKIQSSLQRGWNLARGVSQSGKLTRKDKLPEVAPDIEDKILKYKEKRELSDSCNTSACNSDAEDSVLDDCPLSTSVDISSQRSRLRRRGGGGARAGGKTDSEDESEPSLAQILAMTKNRLSAVSERQRQSAVGEGKSSVEEDAAQSATSQEQSTAARANSAGVDEKEDEDKARMDRCGEAAEQAPAMFVKPKMEAGHMVEMKGAVANESPTPARSALDPCLFVSPMPSREAPTSSASIPHTSIHEGAGKGESAMWGGGGGATVMFSMTPGRGVLDAAGAGEAMDACSLLSPTTQGFWRSLNAQGKDGGGGETRDGSGVVQDERSLEKLQKAVETSVDAGRDGEGGSGLSPTTAAFWQHSQASTTQRQPVLPICAPRVAPTTPREQGTDVGRSSSATNTPLASPRVLEVTKYERPGIYSTNSSSVSCISTSSSTSATSSKSSNSVTEVSVVPPSPGVSQAHKVGLIRVKVVSSSAAYKEEQKEDPVQRDSTFSKPAQAHKTSFSRRSRAKEGETECGGAGHTSTSNQELQREKQQLVPKTPTISFSQPACPLHAETGGARALHRANNTHAISFSQRSQIRSSVLSSAEGAKPRRDINCLVLEASPYPEPSNGMNNVVEEASGHHGSESEDEEEGEQMRNASHAPMAEQKRHVISFSRRSAASNVTEGTPMTMVTTNDSNSATVANAAAAAANATNDTAATTTCTPTIGASCGSAATTSIVEKPVPGKGRKWDKSIVPAGKRVISLEGLQVFSPPAMPALSHHVDLQITSPPDAPKFQMVFLAPESQDMLQCTDTAPGGVEKASVQPMTDKSNADMTASLETGLSDAPATQSNSRYRAPESPALATWLRQSPPRSPSLPHKAENSSSTLAQDHQKEQGRERKREGILGDDEKEEEDRSKKKMRVENERREMMAQQALVLEKAHRQQSPPSSVRKIWNSVSKNKHAPSSASRDTRGDKYSHNAVWEKLMKASPACESSEEEGEADGELEKMSHGMAGGGGGEVGGSATKRWGGNSGSGRKGLTLGRAFGNFLSDNVLRSRTRSQERKRRRMSGDNSDSAGNTPSSGKKRRSSFGGIFDCMLKENTFSPEQPGTPRSRTGKGEEASGKKKESTSKKKERTARAAAAKRDLEHVRFRL